MLVITDFANIVTSPQLRLHRTWSTHRTLTPEGLSKDGPLLAHLYGIGGTNLNRVLVVFDDSLDSDMTENSLTQGAIVPSS
jgi:hypothetical protein